MKLSSALMAGAAGLALVGALLSTPALAQTAAAPAPSNNDSAELDEIIVTGTSVEHTRFQTSYAITTLKNSDIQRRAPIAISDIIGTAPGLYVESSGGVIGNNVYSRGLPNDNYRYIPVLEDGLPVWEEGAGSFTNADIFYRVDETISSAQIVRGGSASITASNAPGGVLNILTKRSSPTLEGVAKVEWGDYDHYRGDFNVTGPISDKLSFHAGGFYRSDNGMRDPGFNGNRGGQFRVGVTYDNGEGSSLYVGYRKLADHAIFYTPIPLASPKKGLPGLSAQTGTLYNSDWRNLIIPDAAGNFNTKVDLGNGVYTNTDTFTVLAENKLNDWLTFKGKGRYTNGHVGFNGVFSQDVASVAGFSASALAQLKAANPATTSIQYRNASTGANIAAGDIGNGLVATEGVFDTQVDVENLIGDLSLTADLGHDNSVTVGYYFSNYDQTQDWNWNNILVEALNRPRLLDVVGKNAAGGDTIALTLNGMSALHSNLAQFTDHVKVSALYAAFSLHPMDALRIDGGVRYHMVDKTGAIANTTTRNLGNPNTIVDDNVAVFTGRFTPTRFSTNQLAVSLGANYEFNSDVAAFLRYSRSFRVTPEFQQWFDCCGNVEKNIVMVEGGLKYSTPKLGAFLTLFYNNFPNISFYNITANGVESAKAAARSYGVEAEVTWKPVSVFDIAFSGNFQSIKNVNFEGADANGPFNYSGNQIRRQPKYTVSIRPTLHLFDNRVDVFSDTKFIGRRYEDIANQEALPAYSVTDAGAEFKVSDRTSVQALVSNVFNQIGITEGNPRAGIITATGGAVFQGRPIFGRHVTVSARMTF